MSLMHSLSDIGGASPDLCALMLLPSFAFSNSTVTCRFLSFLAGVEALWICNLRVTGGQEVGVGSDAALQVME